MFAAGFVGSSNLWPCTVTSVEPEGRVVLDLGGRRLVASTAARLGAGDSAWLLLRPEALAVQPAGENGSAPPERSVRGTVSDVSFLGAATHYRVEADGETVLVSRPPGDGALLAVGDGGGGHVARRRRTGAGPVSAAEGRFGGRVTIVTGGSSGIGRATAERLAAEGSSLCLVAAPFDDEPLQAVADALRGGGTEVVALAADVGVTETAERAVAATLEAFGRVDFLVDNAGIGGSAEVFENTTELFDRTMHVNVRGMYLFAMAAARAMATGGDGGAIVCTASTASFMGEEVQVAYNTSKGAVAALARSLGVALARYRHPLQRRRTWLRAHTGDRRQPGPRRGLEPRALAHPRRPPGGAGGDRGGHRVPAQRRRVVRERGPPSSSTARIPPVGATPTGTRRRRSSPRARSAACRG